jgi:hypothetical protein
VPSVVIVEVTPPKILTVILVAVTDRIGQVPLIELVLMTNPDKLIPWPTTQFEVALKFKVRVAPVSLPDVGVRAVVVEALDTVPIRPWAAPPTVL